MPCRRPNTSRALAVVLPLAIAAAPAQRQAVERAVAAAEARGARTGVAVVDAEGVVLYRHRAAETFAPASNMKLLTAAAVLAGLGAEHRFVTRFALERGALVVEASGDPNWIRGTDNAPERVFAAVAGALQRRGVARVTGIDLRDGTFTGPGRPETWPQDQLYTYYCAPTGPFVLEQGVFWLSVAPGSDGDGIVELLAPPAGRPLRGRIAVVGARKDALYGAIDEGDAVRVRGKVWRKAPRVEIRTAVADPSAWYRDTLQAQLAAAGITVDPGAAGDAADGPVLDHATPLQPALVRMLEDSSNFDAEQCLRVLGAVARGDGSLAGGVAALRGEVEALVGELPAGVRLVDGSGLSRDNRLTPGLLLVVLFRVGNGPDGQRLLDSLPVAGRTGTLDDRFVGTDLVGRVAAKTGWIAGASALTGVVTGADGRRRWFSILMDYPTDRGIRNKELKALQEEIVAGVATMGGDG